MVSAQEHLAALLAMPAEDRIRAANLLLDSVDEGLKTDDDSTDWETRWARELEHRVEVLENGTRTSIDSKAAHERVRERLQALRR